jgi:two-component system cell cycle sensor histidine kinase/response regulator CckA
MIPALGASPDLVGTGPLAARFHLDHYTMEDGLPQNSVTQLAQTREGYLLTSTFGGLARFDGVRFHVFDVTGSPALPEIRFSTLVAAGDRVYLGTQGGRVVELVGERFEPLPDPGEPSLQAIRKLLPAEDGLWVASDEGLARWDGSRWQRWPETGSMTGLVTARGQVYGAGVQGLWRIDPQGPVLLAELGSATGLAASEDHLWLASVPAVAAWSLDEQRLQTVYDPEQDLEYPALALDRSEQVWLWDGSQLRLLGREDELLTAARAGQPSDPLASWPLVGDVRDIFVDRESNLWLGDQILGLVRVTPLAFSRFSLASGLRAPSVQALEVTGEPALVAPVCAGLMSLEGGRFYELPLPTDDACVFSLLRRRSGEIWLGQHHAIFALGQDEPVLTLEKAYTLAEGADGTVWIGTEDGAWTWSGQAPVPVPDSGGATSALVVGPDGAVWLGGLGRVGVARGGQVRWFAQEAGVPRAQVRAVLVDDDGRGAWIGTYGGGLLRFDGERVVRRLLLKDGLPDEVISAILAPGGDELWMNGNRGVWRLPRRQLEEVLEGQRRTLAPVLFASGEGNGGNSAPAGIDPAGRLWFATMDGAISFDPRDMLKNEVAPIPIIESVEVDGVSYDPAGRWSAPPGVRDVLVRFTAAVLKHPRQARFEYRLVPLEERWTEASQERVVRYSHLPPGDYIFEVRASNEDGVWSAEPARLRVSLGAHFIETRAFQLVLALLLASGGLLALHLRTRAARARNRALQSEIDLRRRIEEKLRTSEAHYRSLFEHASDGLLIADTAGAVTAANAAAATLFGCSAEDLLRRNVKGLVREHDGQQEGIRTDGTTFPARMATVPLEGGRVLLSVVDVGELVELQERMAQAERLEAMGRLAGGVAHDFNNLLTVVRANAIALRDQGPQPQGWVEALDQIEMVSRRGSELTRQLLAFGQQQTLRPEAFDVSALVRRMEPVLGRLAREGVRFVVETEGSLPVYADPHQLELVLVNLVLNAIDALEGGGEVRIGAQALSEQAARERFPSLPVPQAPAPRWLDLSVSDTGAGIPPEVLPHLFEPFFTTKSGPGRGLGLASVHGFVTQSDGGVFVTSTVREGSRFDIVLPLSSREVAPAPDPRSPGPEETVTMLLCDDDPLVRRTVERVLRAGGYTVRAVDGPAAALAVLAGGPVDLLVTDVLMPGMTGVELAARARQQYPDLKVIFISGYTRELLPADIADPVVPKPFDPTTLLTVVRTALRR